MSNENNGNGWGWKKVKSILAILAILGAMAYTISTLVVAPVEVKADTNTVAIKAHCANFKVHTSEDIWKMQKEFYEKEMATVKKEMENMKNEIKIFNQHWNALVEKK